MGAGLSGIDPALLLPRGPQGDDERRRLSGKSPLEVAREFEVILMTQVVGAMRKTVPPSAFGQSSTTRMLDGAFDQELARELVGSRGLGLAEQIAQQVERLEGGRGEPGGVATPAGPEAIRHSGTVRATRAVHAVPEAAAVEAAEVAGLVVPVDGQVTSGFGLRADPLTGRARFHGGLDIAAPRGTAIRAAAAGEVVFSGRRTGGGNVVEVRHADGVVTSYAHAERTLVRAGQKVGAGDVIATVGSSGRSTGPHLHFTVSRGGEVIDPTELFTTEPTAGAGVPAVGA